jgi:hypothetical protein
MWCVCVWIMMDQDGGLYGVCSLMLVCVYERVLN